MSGSLRGAGGAGVGTLGLLKVFPPVLEDNGAGGFNSFGLGVKVGLGVNSLLNNLGGWGFGTLLWRFDQEGKRHFFLS